MVPKFCTGELSLPKALCILKQLFYMYRWTVSWKPSILAKLSVHRINSKMVCNLSLSQKVRKHRYKYVFLYLQVGPQLKDITAKEST